MRLLSARTNAQTSAGVGGPVVPLSPSTFSPSSLIASVGPSGTPNESYLLPSTKDDESVYTVRDGDTLGRIAELFDVSTSTIRTANNLSSKSVIKPGQKLTIPPVDGVEYSVAKNDTLTSIAKKFNVSEGDIASFNYILDTSKIAIATKLFIPGGKTISAPKPRTTTTTQIRPSSAVSSSSLTGMFRRPIPGKLVSGYGMRTHPVTGKRSTHKGIDLDGYTGEPIYAAGSGTIKRAVKSGWGGGYGLYVVIDHGANDTLYAHMSRVAVSSGQYVNEGDVIGYVGSTGQSTGPHVHFEVRRNNGPVAISSSIFR